MVYIDSGCNCGWGKKRETVNKEQLQEAHELAHELEGIERALKQKYEDRRHARIVVDPGFTNAEHFDCTGEELRRWLEQLRADRVAKLQALGVEL